MDVNQLFDLMDDGDIEARKDYCCWNDRNGDFEDEDGNDFDIEVYFDIINDWIEED